mmetsp:Transcript_18145/g.44868  ORF Transcript_18145/g.44868 Transcript_18145/m.44868 type:complete len:97 (+) Transcript_18145:525-815(+)
MVTHSSTTFLSSFSSTYLLYSFLLWTLDSAKLLVWKAFFLRFSLYKTFHTRYEAKVKHRNWDDEDLCNVDESKRAEYQNFWHKILGTAYLHGIQVR